MTWPGGGHGIDLIAFSRDGKRIVTGSRDSTARIWDSSMGIEVLSLPINGRTWGVYFSPDGKTLATTSHTSQTYTNQTITLWESAGAASGDGLSSTTEAAK